VVFHAFTQATLVAPVNASVDTLPAGTTTVDLSWASTNKDGDPVLDNVYFGTAPTPPLFKAGNTALKLTVPVLPGLTYYWNVTMIDSHGVMTYGPVWSFTIYDPIVIFTGSYTVLEPVDVPTYTANFTKVSETAISMDNYWDSGWKAVFNMNLTNNTYSMPLTDFGGGYTAIESGTIDQKTGQMKGTYSVFANGADIEDGPHTYNKN